ncbi:molybdopterin-guanine dinucleotide biosynthesis protein B [Paenibacillus sp. CAA11]|uniref:molybdopterin-guanine dinucleotide biosynthesis protein B n=1 Tax=Paenibacillus sp. CAA11 TaxID=1532905 RepID=UPI001F43D6FD|nr:molybdopterin-guanine dinucleotide biosynthesis protein B [Paenibacillus sp. CAA11]
MSERLDLDLRIPPVLQIVGYKNSGKTTVVRKLVEHYKGRGLRVAVIKHDGHEFEMDHEGTDTFRFTEAGAAAVAITSRQRTAVIREEESSLDSLVGQFRTFDLILVEGFKEEDYPKLLLVREPGDIKKLLRLKQPAGIIYWKQAKAEAEAEVRELLGAGGLPLFDMEDQGGWIKWTMDYFEQD